MSGENKNPVGQMIGSLLQPYTELRDRREPPVPPLTAEHIDAIDKAAAIEVQIMLLHSQQDDLLDPVLKMLMGEIAVAKPEDRQRLASAIYKLPRGFHRSEALTALRWQLPTDDDNDGDDCK